MSEENKTKTPAENMAVMVVAGRLKLLKEAIEKLNTGREAIVRGIGELIACMSNPDEEATSDVYGTIDEIMDELRGILNEIHER